MKITNYNPQLSDQSAAYTPGRFNVQDGIEIKASNNALYDEVESLDALKQSAEQVMTLINAAIASKEDVGVAAGLVAQLQGIVSGISDHVDDISATLTTWSTSKLNTSVYDNFITLYNQYKIDTATALGTKVAKDGSKVLTDINYSAIEQASNKKSFNTVNRVGSVFHNPVVVGKFISPQRGFSDGTLAGVTYQYWFKPLFNCTGLQFIFPNYIFGNSGVSAVEAVGMNPITVSFTLYCNGFKQGYINGQTSATIAPGGIVKSDPLPYQLTAGSNYAIRVYVSVGTLGQRWPLGLQTQSTLTEGWLAGDITLSGTSPTITNVNGYGPIGMIGKPTSPRTWATVGLFGDSIFDGNSGGGTGVTLDQGWGRRGLETLGVPWVKFSLGGDVMLNHMAVNGLALQLTNCGGIDIAICNYGANDLSGVYTFDQAQAAYLAYWNALYNQGIRVIQSTVMPRGSFSTAQQAVRSQINAWIRTTPAPLMAYLEVSDIVETVRDSNVWKPGYTADNTHPNSATETIVAAAIVNNPQLFTL